MPKVYALWESKSVFSRWGLNSPCLLADGYSEMSEHSKANSHGLVTTSQRVSLP